MPLKRLHRMILAICILAAVLLTGFLWISSSKLLTPTRRALEPRHLAQLSQPAEYGLSLAPFAVATEDGASLDACLVTAADQPGKAEKSRRMAERLGLPYGTATRPRGTVFLLHGRSGIKEDMLAIAERFVAAGYRCVVYDARCHGQSGGSVCTFGHRETRDFSRVIDAACERISARDGDPGQLCAVGVSLGASVILQSLPREKRLAAVVAVAPFATLSEVVQHAAKRNIHSRIPAWLIAGTLRTGGWRAGFDPFRIAPLDGLRSTSTPVFFVHGALDGVIPSEHSQRLHAAASGTKALRIVPDGNHGNVLAQGGDELYAEMIRFCLAAGTD